MKPIMRLYLHDMKALATNWVAAIIIGGLVFLPSLYAWFNIKASWDPYGRTSGIAVAVVNHDQGATLLDKPLRLGDEIIRSLQDNKQIGWVFTDAEDALHGVQHGDYYASIEIPADFSGRIATVTTGTPTQAELIYTVNEKINAISPKITGKGASGIIEEVNRNFIRVANGAIFSMLNELGIELARDRSTIERLRDLVFKLETLMPEVRQAVATGTADLKRASELAGGVQTALPEAAQLAEHGKQLAEGVGAFLERSAETLDAIAPNVKQDLQLLQQTAIAAAQLARLAQDAAADPAAAKASLERLIPRLATAASAADRLGGLLRQLQALTGGGTRLAGPIGKLQTAAARLQALHDAAARLKDALDRGAAPAEELVSGIEQLARDAAAATGELLQRFDSELAPGIAEAVQAAKQSADKTASLLAQAQGALPDVQRIAADAAKLIADGYRQLAAIQGQMPAIESKIRALADRIRELERQGNLGELIELLRNDPTRESEFFASPALLRENKLFPIPNYGSAMSPFFTTLSLWVGALLLVSLLSVDVHHGEAAYRSYQVYFGRYMTFLTLALLQSLLVTLGDMWLLGAYVADRLPFVLFGLLVSAVFMLMVYTLVSVFGNVGKAMAIVMLVLQLAGSGGTFPVQVTPPFFQAIHPFLPFTYAISMMREAVGGILWDIVLRDAAVLALYAGISLLIGLALKRAINQAAGPLMKKARDSGLLH